MIFPFSVKFTARLRSDFTLDRTSKALDTISAVIASKKGEKITIENNKLSFKSPFDKRYAWRNNILLTIDKGEFVVSQKAGRVVISYEFYLYRLFILTGVMAILFALNEKKFDGLVLSVLCIGVLNWLLVLVRHRIMLNDIINEINEFMDYSF
jgi:hypothetical protein